MPSLPRTLLDAFLATHPESCPRGTPNHRQVVDTFLEACEQISIANDADVRIDADEFTKVLLAEDIMDLHGVKNAEA